MKETIINLKSNKGFTIQDIAIAIVLLLLFVGTIGSIYISVVKVQANTKLDNIATIYAIQILEHIDKIAYEEVQNGIEDELIQKFSIPSSFNVQIEVINYDDMSNPELIKKVKVTIKYNFDNKDKKISIDRLKIKEL